MEKTFKVTDIEYDFDEESDIASPDEVGVPMEMELTVNVEEDMGDDEINDLICDKLSDETGWLVKTFNYQEIKEA